MAEVTDVGITNGVPDTGTGTVPTLSKTNTLIGEVQASPTANTLLDRLKAIVTAITNAALTNDSTHPIYTNPVTVSTVTLTALASAATSAQLLAANAARLGLRLENTDANGVYVKYGTTASSTSFDVYMPGGSSFEMPGPIYTGRIDAIWVADGSGSLYATEF